MCLFDLVPIACLAVPVCACVENFSSLVCFLHSICRFFLGFHSPTADSIASYLAFVSKSLHLVCSHPDQLLVAHRLSEGISTISLFLSFCFQAFLFNFVSIPPFFHPLRHLLWTFCTCSASIEHTFNVIHTHTAMVVCVLSVCPPYQAVHLRTYHSLFRC